MDRAEKAAPAHPDDSEGDPVESRLKDLMDHAQLEARLEVARAKRVEALARKQAAGRPSRLDARRVSDPSDVPLDAPRPSSFEVLPADEPRSDQTEPADRVGLPGARGGTEVAPRLSSPLRLRNEEPRPLPATARANVVPYHAGGPVRVTPDAVQRRQARRWPLAAVALLAGIGLGLGLTIAVPQLSEWQVVIIRPSADEDVAAVRGRASDGQTADQPPLAAAPTIAGRESLRASSAVAPDGEDVARPTGDPVDAGADLDLRAVTALRAPEPVRPRSEGGSETEAAEPDSLRSAVVADQGAAEGGLSPADAAPGPDGEDVAREVSVPSGSEIEDGQGPEPQAAEPDSLRSAMVADQGAAEGGLSPADAAPGPETGEAGPETRVPSKEEETQGTELAALQALPGSTFRSGLPAMPNVPEVQAPQPSPRPGAAPMSRDAEGGERPLATEEARVVLHYPPTASASAQAAAQALSAAGLADVRVLEADVSISSPNVRFFHGADRDTADSIASVLSDVLKDGDVASRSFVDFRPQPDEGLIEVWLAGEAPRAVAASSRRQTSNRPSAEARREAERQRLLQSVEDRLRRQLR